MTIEESKIISSTHTAVVRALSRITGLQDGYIVILQSMQIALNGHEDMKKAMDTLNENLKPTGMKGESYFLSILFLDLISEIEMYLSSIVKAVITEHPRKLGSTSFKLAEVIDAESIDELITRAADEFINRLMYKKPMEYLYSICDVLSIEKDSIVSDWSIYVEAKSRRDLGVHNGWVCNSTYLRKVHEANLATEAKEGDLMVPTYNDYVKGILKNLQNIVIGISEQIKNKYA